MLVLLHHNTLQAISYDTIAQIPYAPLSQLGMTYVPVKPRVDPLKSMVLEVSHDFAVCQSVCFPAKYTEVFPGCSFCVCSPRKRVPLKCICTILGRYTVHWFPSITAKKKKAFSEVAFICFINFKGAVLLGQHSSPPPFALSVAVIDVHSFVEWGRRRISLAMVLSPQL